jgi:hypothetical protein
MAPYTSTFKDCQDSVIDKLRLDPTLDRVRSREWVNQYLLDVAIQSRYFAGSAAGAPLTAGASSQALPAALVELSEVTSTYAGQTVAMSPAGFDQILLQRALQGSASLGQPQVYSLQKNTLEFWPNAGGGESLTYYGSTLPDEMLNDSDVSGLPDPFAINLLVYGAAIEAADYKSDVKLYFYYQQAYAAWLGKFQSFLNQRITQSSRAMPVVGPDGRPFDTPFLPHDPSSDWYVTGARL